MIAALARQSLVYAAATIVQRAAQLVTLLILPWFLVPADYGAVQLIATIAILVNMVATLEITQALARFAPRASEMERLAFTNTAWWFTLAVAALCGLIGLIAHQPLLALTVGDEAYRTVYLLGVAQVALLPIFYFLQNQFRWQFDPLGYGLVSVLFAVVTMAGSILLAVIVVPAITGVMVGQILGLVCAIALAIVRLRAVFRWTFDGEKFRRMIAFAVPLVPAQLSLFGTLYASRLIINDVATLREVGLFTFASQIAAITSVAMIGINTALTPLVMAHHEEAATPPLLARLFEGFTVLCLMLCLALGLFAPQLIDLIGNRDYAGSGPLVMILAPAAVLSQMYIFAPGFFIAKKTSHQMIVSIASAVVGIAATYWLVGRWGILGAAIGTFAGAAMFLTLWMLLSQRLYLLPIRWGRVLMIVALGAFAAAIGMGAPLSGQAWTQGLFSLASIILVGAAGIALGLIPGPRRIGRLVYAQFVRSGRVRLGGEA
jgi:O-antigen/teichoic acid export membrane protein